MVTSLLRKATLLILIGLIACGAQPPPPASPPIQTAVPVAQQDGPQEAAADGAKVALDEDAPDDAPDERGPIPVTSADPAWGSRSAPVTLVVFSDFQCPFCGRLVSTLEQLKDEYGPKKLRVVWKNNPLPFHPNARPAALAAQAVFRLGGAQAFFRFHDIAFRNQRALTPENFEQWAGAAGVDGARFSDALARPDVAVKIDEDLALGKSLGVVGTPASFVNGVLVAGAQPAEGFREIINAQIQKASDLVAAGTPPRHVYAALTAQGFVPPSKQAPSAPPAPDLKVHKVPIAGSPVRGKASALVTIIMFSDFQCPFCGRVTPTIRQLEGEYGDKLRVVWKNNPLPFHPRAEPAAQLALEARAQKGDDAFWKVHDALFAQQSRLEDQELEALAAAQGLNAAAAMRAVHQHTQKAKIEQDQNLAEDLEAAGTPTFFINGRRLVGAQPIEKFRELIDEQIGVAQALVQKGTAAAGVYEAIQKTAVGPEPPETKAFPPPTKNNPSRGLQNAKVTIQIFSDFQCPFCKRVQPTLEQIEEKYPGKIRFVWRNLPLSSIHKQAGQAAEAAMEAFAQRGAKGFWSMHDQLFLAQAQPGGLERQNLEQIAQQEGLDMTRFRTALDTQAHAAAIEAEAKAAGAAGISGTPAFLINGYFLSGAQPFAKFKRLIEVALKGGK